MMKNITIVIHSYNFKKTAESVESARLLTDNIIIIGESDIKNVRVVPFPKTEIVESARDFGIKQATTDWVFLLDADEKMTPELAEEIKSVVIRQNQLESVIYSHYKVPRREILFSRYWLKHGGWWPNYQTRLINKNYFISWPKTIHATPVINGLGNCLNNHLLHYSQNDFSEIVCRTMVFEDKESDLLFNAGRQVKTITFFRKFAGELFRRLIKYLGILDGEIGIIESVYQAYSKTITYIFLYEKKLKKSRALRSLS